MTIFHICEKKSQNCELSHYSDSITQSCEFISRNSGQNCKIQTAFLRKKSELRDIMSHPLEKSKNYFLQFWLYILLFWLYNSKLWVNISPFWEYMSELRDVNLQLWEKSLNCEIKSRKPFKPFLFFIQWRKQASINIKYIEFIFS